ncbi:MAG: hypothetical protein ACU0BB_05885 [Paracoccaceae bacterium]
MSLRNSSTRSSLQAIKNTYGLNNGSFIVAPVPFSDPTIGSGLALGLGYLFQDDKNSNTSVLGFGGLRSENGSQAYGLIANLALNNNRWLVETFFRACRTEL